jgi:hypothetical protein
MLFLAMLDPTNPLFALLWAWFGWCLPPVF